jgi:hypothetical protein
MSNGTIGTFTLEDGTVVAIAVMGMSEVQNINGSKELHVSIAPVIPGGGPGGGEPVPVPKAA